VVERSDDLVHWQAISTNVAVPGGFRIADSEPLATARYFRARTP
jgi:hypothetical protein